jgi:hypothetical protein
VQLLPNGLRWPEGDPIGRPVDEAELGARLADATDLVQADASGRRTRALAPEDLVVTDPAKAGWSFAVHADDPNRDSLVKAVERLATRRGMADPAKPLVVAIDPNDDGTWSDWLEDGYAAVDDRPMYVALVGGVELFPFRFQATFGTRAHVGRLPAAPDELEAYVDKVLRIEDAAAKPARARAVVMATDGPDTDATFWSNRYFAAPLATELEAVAALRTNTVGLPAPTGDRQPATKDALQQALGDAPGYVLTASHGMAARATAAADVLERVNGAICCDTTSKAEEAWLFRGADVVAMDACAEGALWVQFACFGYGTPAQSDFAHWTTDAKEANAPADFVSDLPRRLLAHPRGPVAFIGHVDLAWLQGFADPAEKAELEERISPRLAPFKKLQEWAMVRRYPVGYAMSDIRTSFGALNDRVARTIDRAHRPGQTLDEVKLADLFVRRNDLGNYLLHGDPGVRISLEP